ncbi:MAG: aminotransferase class III-fold pyridoxal phosphate-dependent enzyme, partial [Pseudomonadota bacterium]
RPDFMTIAKGLTSAYAPLSGSIISQRVFDVLMTGTDDFGPLGHGWTYSAHPIGAAAGVATLELVDRLGLVENSGTSGAYLLERLTDRLADHRHVAEVRGVGLLAAVEFMKDPAGGEWFPPMSIGPQIVTEMTRLGVMARAMPEGNIVGLAPPLCITTEEVDQVVEALGQAVDTTFGQ